jgi:hypothetical protein
MAVQLEAPFELNEVTLTMGDLRHTGGGTLNIGNLFGGDDEPSTSTRRVSGGQSAYIIIKAAVFLIRPKK